MKKITVLFVLVVLFFMRCGSLIRLFRSYRCQQVMASCCTKSNNLRNNYLRWSHSIIIIMKSDAMEQCYSVSKNKCVHNNYSWTRLLEVNSILPASVLSVDGMQQKDSLSDVVRYDRQLAFCWRVSLRCCYGRLMIQSASSAEGLGPLEVMLRRCFF